MSIGNINNQDINPTTFVYMFVYIKVTDGTFIYSCSALASNSPRTTDKVWQIARENIATGDITFPRNINSECIAGYTNTIADPGNQADVLTIVSGRQYWDPRTA